MNKIEYQAKEILKKFPKTFYQRLLCIADYLATRKNLFDYQGDRNNENK